MRRENSERDEEELAKRIFLDHVGSPFFMDRNGVLDTYLKYGIGREKEVEWAKEGMEHLLKRFVGNCPRPAQTYSNLLRYIQLIGDIDGLRTLIKLVRSNMARFDTMTLVLLAEETFQNMKDSKYSEVLYQRDLLEEEFNLAKELLTRASTVEFNVGTAYLEQPYWKDNFTEQRIRARIKDDFGELESYLFPLDHKGGFWKWLRSKVP